VAADGGPEPRARPGTDAIRRVVLAGGCGAAVDGALMMWVGPNALLGAPYRWVDLGPLLLAVGLLALAGTLLPSPRRSLRSLARSTPHLIPYAPALANLATFLLWVFSTVAVYQGCLDIFAGAHAGGAGTGVADPTRLQLLIGVASAVFTFLPIYLAVTLRRLIPMGRWADSSGGRDTYGTEVPPPSDALVRAALKAPARDRTPATSGASVGAVTVVSALFVSIGIQLVEVGTAPIPPGLWLESQVAIPVYAAALALAVLAVDRSVRLLEARFAARIRPLGGVTVVSAGPGFVQ
jgi:hypothetical protein